MKLVKVELTRVESLLLECHSEHSQTSRQALTFGSNLTGIAAGKTQTTNPTKNYVVG